MVKMLGATVPINALTLRDMQQLKDGLFQRTKGQGDNAKPISAATVGQYTKLLRAAFKLATIHNYHHQNPMNGIKNANGKRKTEKFTDEELDRKLMKFQKLVVPMMLLALAACGHEGQHWHGVIEHEGVEVEYETFYAPPSVVEKINHSDGIAARIAVNGKTMALSPGIKYPNEWKNDGDAGDFSQKFWGQVAAKLKAVKPGRDHEDDHYILVSMLESLRDARRTLPGDYLDKQALTTADPKSEQDDLHQILDATPHPPCPANAGLGANHSVKQTEGIHDPFEPHGALTTALPPHRREA